MSACASSVAHVGDLFDAHNEKMASGKGASKAKAGQGGKVKGAVDAPEKEAVTAGTNQDSGEAENESVQRDTDMDQQTEGTSINKLYEEGDKSITRVR